MFGSEFFNNRSPNDNAESLIASPVFTRKPTLTRKDTNGSNGGNNSGGNNAGNSSRFKRENKELEQLCEES